MWQQCGQPVRHHWCDYFWTCILAFCGVTGGHSEASLADNIIPRFFRKRTGSLFSNRSDTIQEATDDEDGIPPPVDPELGGPSHASFPSLDGSKMSAIGVVVYRLNFVCTRNEVATMWIGREV